MSSFQFGLGGSGDVTMTSSSGPSSSSTKNSKPAWLKPGYHPNGKKISSDGDQLASASTGANYDDGTEDMLGNNNGGNSSAINDIRQKRKNIQNQKPWAEKHRPKSFKDIIQSSETMKRLFEQVVSNCNSKDQNQNSNKSSSNVNVRSKNNIPHFLFSGPPGTGKTTSAWALMHELFGKRAISKHVLALNASDDRGVDVIRKQVKPYCETPVNTQDDEPDQYPSPALKFVILDEFDSVTFEAQTALRRVIEENTDNTRFILCCNYISKVIDPIQSRCSGVTFAPLNKDAHLNHLKMICKKENISVDEDTLKIFVKASRGDCRRSITSLQAAKLGFQDSPIDGKEYINMTGMLHATDINRILTTLFDTSDETDNHTNTIQALCDELIRSAYNPILMLRPLLEALITTQFNNRLTDYQCAKAGFIISEINGLIREGVPADGTIPQLFFSLYHTVIRGPKTAEEQRLHDNQYTKQLVMGSAVEAGIGSVTGLDSMTEKRVAQRKWGHVVY